MFPPTVRLFPVEEEEGAEEEEDADRERGVSFGPTVGIKKLKGKAKTVFAAGSFKAPKAKAGPKAAGKVAPPSIVVTDSGASGNERAGKGRDTDDSGRDSGRDSDPEQKGGRGASKTNTPKSGPPPKETSPKNAKSPLSDSEKLGGGPPSSKPKNPSNVLAPVEVVSGPSSPLGSLDGPQQQPTGRTTTIGAISLEKVDRAVPKRANSMMSVSDQGSGSGSRPGSRSSSLPKRSRTDASFGDRDGSSATDAGSVQRLDPLDEQLVVEEKEDELAKPPPLPIMWSE